MNEHFDKVPTDVNVYRKRFMDTISFIGKVFPHGFRRTEKGVATPRARFEAIAVGSFLALQRNPSLNDASPRVDEWLASEGFSRVTGSDGANAIARLRARIDFVRDHLLAPAGPG